MIKRTLAPYNSNNNIIEQEQTVYTHKKYDNCENYQNEMSAYR